MNTWEQLDASTESAVWERFEAQFLFRSGNKTPDWPGILEPSPSITYSISDLLKSDGKVFEQFAYDLDSKVLTAFRHCIPPHERLYALDWQHACYRFFPHNQSHIADPTSWPVTIFPYGDYSIFITEDFRTGTFGHPWRETICVFGKDLTSLIQNNLPISFQELRRNL